MRKRLISLILLVIGLLSFTSCDMDFVDTYMISNSVELALNSTDTKVKEEVKKNVEKYLNSCFDLKETELFYGAQYDAMTKASEFFIERVKKIDQEKLLALLPNQNDVVRYDVLIEGSKLRVSAGYMVWIKNTKIEEKPEDSTPE